MFIKNTDFSTTIYHLAYTINPLFGFVDQLNYLI